MATATHRAGLDALQLHGDEDAAEYARCGWPVIKAVAGGRRLHAVGGRGRAGGVTVLLDAHDPVRRGGTGQTDRLGARRRGARGSRPVILSGGLNAENVADAIDTVRPYALDVSSGVESAPGIKDRSEAARVLRGARRTRQWFARRTRALNNLRDEQSVIRASAIRTRAATTASTAGGSSPRRLSPRSTSSSAPTSRRAQDEAFRAELGRSAAQLRRPADAALRSARLSASLGGARIFLKREDLAHTGAHKINNALGQALLAKRMGKRRIIAETGAGQHGVATATVCALLGLECDVYMGAEDMARQSLNVFRMQLLGATVRARRRRQRRRSRTPSTRRCATG